MQAKPMLSIDRAGGLLTRRIGLFRKTFLLADVVEIWAVNSDALTFDEVSVHLMRADGEDFSMKEYESGFDDVMLELAAIFPRVECWRQIGLGTPLEFRKKRLWP